MSLKSRLRPLHLRLRKNSLYENFYLTIRPKARKKLSNAPKPPAKPITAAQKRSLVDQGRASVVNTLIQSGDYSVAKKVVKNLIDEDGERSSPAVWAVKAELALCQANHDEVINIANEMTQVRGMPKGHFFAAQSHFARGNNSQAMHHIQSCLMQNPKDADCVYLLCDLADRTNQKDLARDALERLVKTSRRAKSWLAMANMVDSDSDFLRMQASWFDWHTKLMKKAFNKDSREYLALGAMRVGNYELAKEIWRNSLMQAASAKNGFGSFNVRSPSYSSNRAEVALADLNETLKQSNIPMFLVSGTLLGCIREGKLLGHDKDIDVGIWSDVSPNAFFEALSKTGQFLPLASRSEHIIRLKHVNGIAVDIFYHYKDPDDYWHAGVKMKWSNTPFELVEKEFLGQTHLIPKDYDLYLTENYGDWKTPKIDFDSAFDTPNGTVLNEDEMVIHAFKGLQNACIAGKSPQIYLNDLRTRGESDFVDRFIQHVTKVDPETAKLI